MVFTPPQGLVTPQGSAAQGDRTRKFWLHLPHAVSRLSGYREALGFHSKSGEHSLRYRTAGTGSRVPRPVARLGPSGSQVLGHPDAMGDAEELRMECKPEGLI